MQDMTKTVRRFRVRLVDDNGASETWLVYSANHEAAKKAAAQVTGLRAVSAVWA